MLIKKYVIGLCLLMLSVGSFAHGLMESPASRNWFCGAVTKPDEVANGTAKYPVCGTAFNVNSIAGYSFMSVLTHNLGVSVVSPLPTNVCSADSETWKGAVTPWDVPMEWPTNPITAGKQDIVWNISWGPHFSDTLEFRYWITKSDFVFSPTKALTWSDFEATPFCVLPYDDTKPTANPDVIPDAASAHFTTKCTIPARSGHHVMYGEWGRQPVTYERFHGCVDLAFSGVSNPVTATIAATPSSATVTGATTIAFSAAGSTGTNLTYQWAVESPNTALYSFSSTTAASTTLSLQAPAAQTALTVRLTVSNGTNSASKTLSFTHVPGGVYSFADMGVLTATSKALTVGDKVQVRMVDSTGVDTYFPTTALVITSANSAATAWPYALAQAINGVNSKIQIGVLANNTVTAAQNATSNRIYAALPSTYVSAFVNVVGANASSSSAAASSKSSSSVAGAAQCNWYGTLYPLCVTTASGWGWENNKNCIATVTCAAQPAPYGVVGGTASSTASSSVVSSSVASSVAVSSSSKSSSSVATSTSSAASSTGGGVLFQENFESGAVNTQPAGWDNYLSWIYNNSNTTSGTDYALIDSSKAYSGSKSIHFKGGLAEIVRALPAGTQHLHMRAYVNLSKKMGNDAADNHEHIMGIKKTKDANNEVRIGQIKGVLGTNDAPTDNIAPPMSKWYSGPQLVPNTWYCVETALYADTAYDQLYMWVNGTLVHSITSDADWNNGAIGANWMSDKFNYVMFGFHSFDNATSDVWMDDIVVSTQPIGCGTNTSSSSVASSASSSKSSSVVVSSSSRSSVVASSSSSSKSSVASSVIASSSSKSSVASSSVASSVKSSSSSSVATAANCSYVVESEWNTAAQVNIVIKNNGTTPINGWNVSWKYASGTTVTSYFNAVVTGTNPYTATNVAWNGTIQPGQSVQFGFGASKGVVGTPAEKPVVTGAVCN